MFKLVVNPLVLYLYPMFKLVVNPLVLYLYPMFKLVVNASVLYLCPIFKLVVNPSVLYLCPMFKLVVNPSVLYLYPMFNPTPFTSYLEVNSSCLQGPWQLHLIQMLTQTSAAALLLLLDADERCRTLETRPFIHHIHHLRHMGKWTCWTEELNSQLLAFWICVWF